MFKVAGITDRVERVKTGCGRVLASDQAKAIDIPRQLDRALVLAYDISRADRVDYESRGHSIRRLCHAIAEGIVRV